jgi:hypothetical protein
MQEYWEIYMKSIDGYPSSVSFNAGIIHESRKEMLPYLGFIKLTMHEPNEKGLISEAEAVQLQYIEDNIEAAVLRYKIGNYVGKIVTNATVSFIFYLKYDFEWQDVVQYAFRDIEDYGYEFGSREDSQWEVYHKLLEPDMWQWQIIHNHNACERLRAQGDTLETMRAIEHSAYFEQSKDAQTFTCKATEEGFTCNEVTSSDSGYKVSFYRKDRPHFYEIDAMTLQLIELSITCNGAYDGWECAVVKS